MESEIEKLNQINDELKQGKTATPVTIREFLSWFGAQRRTSANVEYIDKQLQDIGIRTIPMYLTNSIDTPITFELTADHPASETDKKDQSNNYQNASIETEERSSEDPSYRISRIASANIRPVSVKPNESLLEAVTRMHFGNFSQLPVMTSDREVKGVISWESIGARSAKNITGAEVKDYMDDYHEVSSNASLFEAIKTIVSNNYVLIRGIDKTITGIVTSTNIVLQFEEISTPFMLIAEIEKCLRMIISRKLSMEDIKTACREEYLPKNFDKVSDLTFGNYVKILDYPDNWSKIGLNLDRKMFCNELSIVNEIRNDVVHFDLDPLSDQNLLILRNVAKTLDLLRSIGVF